MGDINAFLSMTSKMSDNGYHLISSGELPSNYLSFRKGDATVSVYNMRDGNYVCIFINGVILPQNLEHPIRDEINMLIRESKIEQIIE